MDDQNKNLILATALSFLVILGWFLLFPPEEPVVEPGLPETAQPAADTVPTADVPTGAASVAPEGDAAAAPETIRVPIDTARLSGSVALTGGRIDELALRDYRAELNSSESVPLLMPIGSEGAYYAQFGWAPGGDLTWDDVPGADTVWTAARGATLTTATPLHLSWTNGKGQVFNRRIAVDENYLFTITQSVENRSGSDVRMAAYSALKRHGEPQDLTGFFIIQEGPIRQSGTEMNEFDYDDMQDFGTDERWGANAEVLEIESNGWLGFTDHYWMTTLVPAADSPFTSVFKYDSRSDVYSAEARHKTLSITAGTSAEVTTQLFAGAKEWDTIHEYQNTGGIYKFIDPIDWGWFFS